MDAEQSQKKKRGILGEEAAARYLEAEGYEILERNFSLRDGRIGEVDIIVQKEGVIAFVEVRSGSGNFVLPHQTVTLPKQRRIARAAIAYISFNNIRNCDFRFDIIEVYLDFSGHPEQIEHIQHAFELPKGFFI